jgi:peroxiredoxin
MPTPLPRQPVPPLQVPLVGGGSFDLQRAQPTAFTLVLFYRGLHCPQCKQQLAEYDRRLDELTGAGVDEVLAVSGDDLERAERSAQEWELGRLPLGYGLTEDVMRSWGLYLSKGVKDPEPALFNEPGLFLIRPDATLYSTHVQSTPFGRPHLDNLLGALRFIQDNDYPARGEA